MPAPPTEPEVVVRVDLNAEREELLAALVALALRDARRDKDGA